MLVASTKCHSPTAGIGLADNIAEGIQCRLEDVFWQWPPDGPCSSVRGLPAPAEGRRLPREPVAQIDEPDDRPGESPLSQPRLQPR